MAKHTNPNDKMQAVRIFRLTRSEKMLIALLVMEGIHLIVSLLR